MQKATLILCLLFGLSQPALAQVTFASTSFEEPAVVSVQYVDTGDPLLDHDLVNNTGEPYVDYTSVGGELGFDAYYFNTRGGVGLTDGDYVGATDYAVEVGSYVDGSQGYQISDADGMMTVAIDQVDLTGATAPHVSLYYFPQSTGWETSDSLRIWVEVDGGTEIDLVNTAGFDIDDLGIEGSWNIVEVNLTSYTFAILRFQLDCNSGTEAVYFDHVRFSDGPIPVELVSFVASATTNQIELTWDTASEQDNLGFNVFRSTGDGFMAMINESMVPGAGTTLEPMFYSYVDRDITSGQTYRYWLEQVDFQGTTEMFGPVSVVVPATMPEAVLLGASPLPVDDATSIELSLPAEGMVSLSVYDLQGRAVSTIWKGSADTGTHTFNWERGDVAPGTYMLRAATSHGDATLRVILR